MKCCGQDRDSAFCPDCGKAITPADPLLQLLAYLRAREGEREDSTTAEWKTWGDELEGLIKGRAEAVYRALNPTPPPHESPRGPDSPW